MAYNCNKCGYVGLAGPEHSVPGRNSACPCLATEFHAAQYVEPELDDKQREILHAALAAADKHYVASLAGLPLDEYRPTRTRYLTARHETVKILLRMQIAHKMSDGAYSALLMMLAQELTISGLQSYPTQDEKVRDRVLFKHNLATFARAVRAMLVPDVKRDTGLVNADGKPITKRTRH